MTTPTCKVCALPTDLLAVLDSVDDGPKRAHLRVGHLHADFSVWGIRRHRAHRAVQQAEDTVSSFADDYTAGADSVDREYLDGLAATVPDVGYVGSTVTEVRQVQVLDEDGNPTGETATVRHYHRTKPDQDVERIALREPDPVNVRIYIAAKLPKRQQKSLKCAFFLPDTQFNYWQDRFEQWHTTADEAAIDVAFQILADVQAEHGVDELVQLGDFVDLPQFSKHRSSPAQLTIAGANRTFRRASRFLAEATALTPDARRRLLRGNHDERLILSLIDSKPELCGIAPEGDVTGPPLVSLERLLGVARNGWELSNPYPHERIYLRPDWKAVHGDCVAQTVKQTNDRYLGRSEEHTTYGHTHRQGLAWKTIEKDGRFVRISAGSPGTLCRIDGAVPSAKGAHTEYGEPSLARGENWEQGVQVSFFEPEAGGLLQHETITIQDGRASWRGRLYVARCDVNGALLAAAA